MTKIINLRMPDGLRDKIKDAAKASNRSMHAEILHRVGRQYNAPASQSVLSARGSRDADQTIFRIPVELHASLVKAAEGYGRSLNAECVWRLLASFEDEGAPMPEPQRSHVDHLELIEVRNATAKLLDKIDALLARGNPA
jgi:hypothetical protein